MRNLAATALLIAASVAASPAAAITIDFEDGTAGAPVVAQGATFTNTFYNQCGGGCPDPVDGIFASGLGSLEPFTVTFDSFQSQVSFINVSFSNIVATAFDEAGQQLDRIAAFDEFPISGDTLSLTSSFGNIRYVTFEGGSDVYGFGIDNLSYALGGAVPEPATWAMMIGGIGMSGGAMRRSRRRRATGLAAA